MKFLLGILIAMTSVFSMDVDNTVVFEKLIITSSKSEKALEALKVYGLENFTIRTLQKKHHFYFLLEKFGKENVIVIKPIKSKDVRNTLLILLSPKFENIFYLKYEEQIKGVLKNDTEVKKSSWIRMRTLQWIALLLLFIIGLILFRQSRKKIANLEESQVNLKQKQKTIEIDIHILRRDDVI